MMAECHIHMFSQQFSVIKKCKDCENPLTKSQALNHLTKYQATIVIRCYYHIYKTNLTCSSKAAVNL